MESESVSLARIHAAIERLNRMRPQDLFETFADMELAWGPNWSGSLKSLWLGEGEAIVVADDPRVIGAVAGVPREDRRNRRVARCHDVRRGDTAGRFSTRPATADISAVHSSSSPS